MLIKLYPTENPMTVDIPTSAWNVTPEQTPPDTWNAEPGDYVVFNAQTAGYMGVVLPDATTCKGQSVIIKDASFPRGAADSIKVNTVNGQTIDGESTTSPPWKLSKLVGTNSGGMVQFMSDGANWIIALYYNGKTPE
jgi:hypothetical protein